MPAATRFSLPVLLLAAVSACTHGHATTATAPPGPAWQTAAVQAMSTIRATPAHDETCRQVLRATATGRRVRLRLSNVMSPAPLRLTAVTVALRKTGPELLAAPQRVTVAGSPTVTIAAGAHVTTDAVDLRITRGADVAVSFAVGGSATLSEHLLGAATGWCTPPGSGDRTSDLAGTAFTITSREGLVVEALEVAGASARDGVLAVGDSLTDPPLPPDTYQRWTDVVAGTGRAVANVAIGGNRVMHRGGYGRTLTERFADDLLTRPGVGTLVVFAGTNDVSDGVTAAALTDRLTALIQQAREHRLRVVLVTLVPAWKRPPDRELVRQQVNTWIRSTPYADVRVDADRLLRDPTKPTHLLPAYDWGDGLHLSAAGQRTLGEAIVTALTG